MKDEFLVVLIVWLAVFGFVYLIYSWNSNSDLTGFVVHDDSTVNVIEDNSIDDAAVDINESINVSTDVKRQQVLDGIEEALLVIADMGDNNFSTLFLNDTLIAVRVLFEQVEFAEILRDKSSSRESIFAAETALRYVDWEDIYYDDVLDLLNGFDERREQAFFIYDSIGAAKINLGGYLERGINVINAQKLLRNAEISFYEDRYEESLELLDAFKEDLKLQTLAFSTLRAVQRGIRTFIEKYWTKYWYIFIFVLALLSIFVHFAYRIIIKAFLKRKISNLVIEKRVIFGLMKKAQRERYKLGSISGLVYRIRMKKYRERLSKMEEELPILETKLEKMTIRSGYLTPREPRKGSRK